MSVQVGVGYIDIRPDFKGFGQQLRANLPREVGGAGDAAGKKLSSSLAASAKRAAAAFGAAFAAVKIKDFFGGAIKAASDLAESTAKAGQVFGAATAQVRGFAAGAAKAIGQSNQQALEATGTFGNLFTAMGIGQGVSANMSISLVKLASDLASFNNVPVDDALLALRSGLVGEQEPLRRFGVNINEATLKAKALELGLRVGKGTLDASVKAQAAYALVLEQTTTAQGDFERTAGGLANQQKIMQAQWTDTKAELGEGLLPVMIELAGFINDDLIPAWKTLFTVGQGEATGWAATLRNVIGDTLGFVIGALQEVFRLIANVATKLPLGWGDAWAADLREAADAADGLRDRLHATKGELIEWEGATRNADAAAKLLVPSTKAIGTALKGALGPTEESIKATEDLAAARRDLDGANRDLADANRGLAKAQSDYDKALTAFGILGTDTARDELADATENLADAQDTVADAKDGVADAQDKVNDKEDDLVAATPKVVGAIGARTDAVKALNDQLGITKDHLGILNDIGNITGKTATTGQPFVAPTPLAGSGPLLPDQLRMPGAVSDQEFADRTRGWGNTNNVTVNVTQPLPDPGLVGKQIAWALD